jgi:hypothetical protein
MTHNNVKPHVQQPPTCPVCKDRGWYEGTTYDPNFGWSRGETVCVCVQPVPLSKFERWFLKFLGVLACLLVLVQMLRSFGVIQ